ncbi:MAG: hypothetical protein WD042_20170 [Phycisphaeraceae bacterium]
MAPLPQGDGPDVEPLEVLDWPATFRPPLGVAPTLLVIAALVVLAVWLHLAGWRRDEALGLAMSLPRRVVLLVLRLSALALVAFILAGPSVDRTADTAPLPVKAVVLADASISMATVDVPRPGGGSAAGQPVARWDALTTTWLDPLWLLQLRDRGDVQLLRFAGRVEPISAGQAHSAEPDGDSTDLYGAIHQVLPSREGGVPPGVLVILSDGHDTIRGSDPATVERLARLGWRVIAVPVGERASTRDVSILVNAEADHLFEGQSTWIDAAVWQRGYDQGQVDVDLVEDGRVLESQRLGFDHKPTVRARFKVTPAAARAPGAGAGAGAGGDSRFGSDALHAYRVVARLVDDGTGLSRTEPSEEATTDNNQQWAFVQVSRRRIRVALFEGQPYWDTRFLARVLADDAQVELTTHIALGEGRVVVSTTGDNQAQAAFDPAAMTQEQLNAYDVVVLGRGIERFFAGDRAALIKSYVADHGGALVLARGQPFDADKPAGAAATQAMQSISPVRWGRGTVGRLALEATAAGQASPLMNFPDLGKLDAIVTRMPDMLAATRIQGTRAGTVVLLEQSPRSTGQGAPPPRMAAIAHQSAGRGRVLAVLSDGLWRWAFLPATDRRYDSVYQGFWSRAIRWLATGGEFLPGRDLAMSLDRLSSEPGQPVTVTVTSRSLPPADFAPTVRITGPDGAMQALVLPRGSEQSTRFEAVFEPKASGVYELEMVYADPHAGSDTTEPPEPPEIPEPQVLSARLAVYESNVEKLDPSARPETLKELADATHGLCLGLEDREQLRDLLTGYAAARASDRRLEYAFAQPGVFIALAALFFVDWFLRRRWGSI